MDLKADETPAGQAVAAGAAQPQQPPGAPSKEERNDFLKQAIAFTEWTIRSFDTKARPKRIQGAESPT